VKKPNTIERDIDEIREKIYNDTKDMTVRQFNDYFRDKANATAQKYNFKRAATTRSADRP
jgi:hypothetical protein